MDFLIRKHSMRESVQHSERSVVQEGAAGSKMMVAKTT